MKLSKPRPFVCEHCGGALDVGEPGDAAFFRAVDRICWPCLRLKKSVEREAEEAKKVWTLGQTA